jgi:hypothetical protein
MGPVVAQKQHVQIVTGSGVTERQQPRECQRKESEVKKAFGFQALAHCRLSVFFELSRFRAFATQTD